MNCLIQQREWTLPGGESWVAWVVTWRLPTKDQERAIFASYREAEAVFSAIENCRTASETERLFASDGDNSQASHEGAFQ